MATIGGSDRRTIALSLTRRGRTEHQRIETLLDAQVGRVISRIPPAQRAAISHVLGLIHDAYVLELAGNGGEEGSRQLCEVAS